MYARLCRSTWGRADGSDAALRDCSTSDRRLLLLRSTRLSFLPSGIAVADNDDASHAPDDWTDEDHREQALPQPPQIGAVDEYDSGHSLGEIQREAQEPQCT